MKKWRNKWMKIWVLVESHLFIIQLSFLIHLLFGPQKRDIP